MTRKSLMATLLKKAARLLWEMAVICVLIAVAWIKGERLTCRGAQRTPSD
jgi:hypothetical protein